MDIKLIHDLKAAYCFNTSDGDSIALSFEYSEVEQDAVVGIEERGKQPCYLTARQLKIVNAALDSYYDSYLKLAEE